MSPKYMLQVLFVTCILMFVKGQTNGALRLRTRSGTTLTNNFGTGAVELYYNGEWGTICSTSSFRGTEASVICNGISNSSTFVATHTTTNGNYGSANLAQPIVTDVNCLSSTSTILQCSLNFTANACDELTDAVVVSCVSSNVISGVVNNLTAIIIGVVVGFIVLSICIAVLPIIICCCCFGGLACCAAAAGSAA